MTVDDLLAAIAELGNLAGLLSTAKQADRPQLYEALDITATYDATARTAVLKAALPRSAKDVSEGGLVGRRDEIRLSRTVSLAP